MLRELRVRHGFSQKEADAWKKIAKDINQVYDGIVAVASQRAAHAKAYEAAVTTLFKLEMEAVDPSKVDGTVQYEAAFEAVNAKIGQPPHKADRKYQIEAFLLSIELRLMLAQIASARLSGLPLTPDPSRRRQIWSAFVGFLYDSCIKDCGKAASLARSCLALKKEVRVCSVNLRCIFEKARFEMLEESRKIHISNRSDEDRRRMRASLGTLVAEQWTAARKSFLEVSKNSDLDIHFFRKNCIPTAKKIRSAFVDLQDQVLKAEVFYESVTLQEKQDIVEAFGFGSLTDICVGRHPGHLYNCENGHAFVIAECGGAVEVSTCPECQAPIGGHSHRLTGLNARKVEFETLAKGDATENPWAPGGYMANIF
jgi:hypothetical protein